MQKLTDQEFNSVREGICNLGKLVSAEHPMRSALQKLLANYQEQLEAESYVAAELYTERYTEANTCTTTLDLDLRDLDRSCREGGGWTCD